MAVTNVTVEVGFSSTMLTASPTWTDITAYVRRASVQRGRPSVEGRFTTGTASLVLDNRDGRFTPENSGSPYANDNLIGVPVRITVSLGMDAPRPIFYGSARAWPPTFPKSQDSFVTVPLADGFFTLNSESVHDRAYSEESTDTRLGNVLDDIGWPAGLRNLDTGLGNVQAVDFDDPGDGGDQPALLHILDVAEAEAGVLFMSREGNVEFQNRVALSGASAAANFTDSEMSEIVVGFNGDHIFNEIRVAREDGAQITYTDTSSVTAIGRRVLTRDVMPMSNDAEALNVAEWLAGVFGTQQLRVESMKFKMHDNASFLADVLDLELRDVVNVNHVPPAGDTISQDCAVEGIRHDMQPGEWTTTLTVVPLATVESQSYWILGTSQLDVSTRLA